MTVATIFCFSKLLQFESNALRSSFSVTSNKDENTSEILVNDIQRGYTVEEWIEKSFNSTYAFLLEDCPNPKSKVDVKACITSTYKKLSDHSTNGTMSIPWWFNTLLRDATRIGSGLFGGWHELKSSSPPVQMCTIEKIGTTSWRQTFCVLNNEEPKGLPCSPRLPPPESAPKFVFLRDPLERFLSGFIDKCIRSKEERHCEPTSVFTSEDTSMVKDLDKDKKALFSAYVDAMPLTWNLHFFPASLYCDGLFRNINNYDFVGRMDTNFYRDLHRLSTQFGDEMSIALDTVFDYREKINNTNIGKETKSPDQVKEYYSGRLVRRMLEYLSIDYIMLNFTVPDWAREMLENDL